MSEETQLSGITKVVRTLLRPIIQGITPLLESMLEDFLVNWYEEAKKTESPFDDIAAEMILDLFDVPHS